ncbi:Fbox domain containing protein [Acanthamoeba castellanii str. Neff]|uniref:Fbox domain containing protein n=1 Tax=Acanthamoeba castellanii (strain ATCC 30010 / Neff) TaxID=1257118 RepID=L8H6S1_ACACF|nr:Fbox domain containing protein [Acanthamoeba castellanii str. Neff]ELR20438.1 Fbox domain containing protein [Acanthamoeba castellanii str. Neff]
MATFKELRKEQFGQLAALEGQIEGLQQELAGERARSQGVQEQVGEARLAYEQKERELQEMLRIAREEASALESAAARAGTRESEMATRLDELEAQLARRSEEEAVVIPSAAAAQRSDEDREARLREREEEMRTATEEWERERGERDARVEALTAQLTRANGELAQLKAALAEGEERARLTEERAAVAERTLATATAEWAERQGQAERLYAEQGAALAELGARLAAFEERLPEIESRAVRRGREEVQGDLDRLQAEHALLSSQLKQAEKEARAYKAEAEALRNELAQVAQKPAGAALASHPGFQTRRRLEPEMRAAADVSSPAAASADHDTRKVRRRSEPDKEQDITDLLQSDDVVQTRPRTMPATTSGQSLPAAASADHRTDPVEYLSEELVLYMFSRLSARDLLSLTRVNRKYRRIASDASLWRPKCQRLWHFQESEGSAYTDTDWKEVYVYRHTHYKQVSCVVVGDENVGKKTLITAFEGMVTQKGWKRGQERERCTVCVESLFGVPTMFHLTVLKANPPDPCSDLMHHLADHLTRTKVDVFLLCVPASGSVEATKSRLDALESKVLPALDALCPDVPRILVGTETDIKEEHYDHSHPTAIPMSFSNFVERHHCHAAVLTSAMSNRNLVELFDMAQSLVATPNLRLKVSHDQVVVMNQTIRSKERKPPRSTALGPRASTQYGHPDAVAPLPTPLQTSPSSPRRQGGAPARGAASPYVAPATATPSPSTPYGGRGGPSATPYTPYGASSSSLFTPSPSTPADGPPLSPYLYNHPVSQSTPLPTTGAGSPLASAASTGTTTPGSTTRNWRRLRSSASDTPRSQRDNKCALQ